MRTTTERPVRLFTTRTRVPNGRVRCAAVSAFVLKVSPLAVRRPWKPGPYQEARPERVFPEGSALREVGPTKHAVKARAAATARLGARIMISRLSRTSVVQSRNPGRLSTKDVTSRRPRRERVSSDLTRIAQGGLCPETMLLERLWPVWLSEEGLGCE